MYKKTHRAEAFGDRVASRSIRPFRKGYSDQGFEVVQHRSLVSQRDDLARQERELGAAIEALDAVIRSHPEGRAPAVAERQRLRAVLANATRMRGHLDATIRDAARLAFETLFMRVAGARLHKDVFLSLNDEARMLWRAEGWADGHPEATKRQEVKQMKRRAKEDAQAA